MVDFPTSLVDFQTRFPDEAACAAWLFEARWPTGFGCPACDHDKAWPHGGKAFTYECAACGRQTSVTAGTIMHSSKLPLTVWFWAAYLMATHSNGISALQLQRLLALGSYKSAWLLCAKLRRAMVAPARALLAGIAEIDGTKSPCAPRTIRSGVAAVARPRAKCSSQARSKSPTARPAAFASQRCGTFPRRLAARFCRRQPGSRRNHQNRWMGRPVRRAQRRSRSPCRRQHGCPYRAAVDPSRLLQLEDLGARRLPRPAKETSPKLSRRIKSSNTTAVALVTPLSLATLHRPYNQTHYLRNVDPTGICGISL